MTIGNRIDEAIVKLSSGDMENAQPNTKAQKDTHLDIDRVKITADQCLS